MHPLAFACPCPYLFFWGRGDPFERNFVFFMSDKRTTPFKGALNPRILVILALALPIISWGSAFPSIRIALRGYTPVEIALVRFIIGSSILILWSSLKGFRLPDRADIPMICFLSLTGIVMYHLPLNIGSRTITAGTVSLLNATAPVFTALLSCVLIGERIHFNGWAGIVLSFLGASLLAFSGGEGFSISFGALWVLFAAFSESFYFIYQKGLLIKYGALRLTSYVFAAGTLMILPFSGGLVKAAVAAPVVSTVAVVYMGIFPTAIAYVLWAYDMSIFPASKVASLLYLSPVLSIILGWYWLDEIPTGLSIIGGVLAILGVFLVQNARIKASEREKKS